MDYCNALRHAIQDLIDQGLVNLGQPSVTTNPLPAHFTHTVPPSSGDIHPIDLIEDDSIHMLSWDDGLPEPIVLHVITRLLVAWHVRVSTKFIPKVLTLK